MEKTVTLTQTNPSVALTLDTLIARHGAWRVAFAALRAALRVRRRPMHPPPPESLPDHIRRDVGLPPLGPVTPVEHRLRQMAPW